MIDIVQSYCDKHGIQLSTNQDLSQSKTKCIIFNSDLETENVLLYGVPLPWVDSWKHLGHTIHRDMSSSHDILQRNAEFVGKIHALQQELGRVDPKVFLLLVQIYLSSFYGSNLWDLTSASAGKLYSTWNRMIGTLFNLPFGTHRYILRELSGHRPLQQTLCRRFYNFCQQIENSRKPEVIHLFNLQKFDSRSIFGKNYKNIIVFKRDFSVNYTVPLESKWRIPFVEELLDIRANKVRLEHFPVEAISVILKEVCCS